MQTPAGPDAADAVPSEADLLAALVALLDDRPFRTGKMFGHPALYLGRTMFACAYGAGIGLRVPAEIAAEAIDEGAAIRFQPHGRQAMREWIELRPASLADLASGRRLLLAAYDFAHQRSNNSGGQP